MSMKDSKQEKSINDSAKKFIWFVRRDPVGLKEY